MVDQDETLRIGTHLHIGTDVLGGIEGKVGHQLRGSSPRPENAGEIDPVCSAVRSASGPHSLGSSFTHPACSTAAAIANPSARGAVDNDSLRSVGRTAVMRCKKRVSHTRVGLAERLNVASSTGMVASSDLGRAIVSTQPRLRHPRGTVRHRRSRPRRRRHRAARSGGRRTCTRHVGRSHTTR